METIGLLAGLLTLSTYIPQAIKTLKTRQTRDLSLPTYLMLVASAGLWIIYGLGRDLPSVWITNSVVGILALLILLFKLRKSR